MVTDDEGRRTLVEKYPQIAALAVKQEWWSPTSPLRWWLSFEGYSRFLRCLDSTLDHLNAQIPKLFPKLTRRLLDPSNFWGHTTEVYLAHRFLAQGITIEDIERPYPYGTHRPQPDFVTSVGADYGVVEVKTYAPSYQAWEESAVADMLSYILNETTSNLPIGLELTGVPNDWPALNQFFDEFMSWQQACRGWVPGTKVPLSAAKFTLKHRVVPRGIPDWSVVRHSGFVDPTMANPKKFFDELSAKKTQVQGHCGFNCIVVDTSWYALASLMILVQSWPNQWFEASDRDGIVSGILTVQVDRTTGMLATPTYWENPHARVRGGALENKLRSISWM